MQCSIETERVAADVASEQKRFGEHCNAEADHQALTMAPHRRTACQVACIRAGETGHWATNVGILWHVSMCFWGDSWPAPHGLASRFPQSWNGSIALALAARIEAIALHPLRQRSWGAIEQQAGDYYFLSYLIWIPGRWVNAGWVTKRADKRAEATDLNTWPKTHTKILIPNISVICVTSPEVADPIDLPNHEVLLGSQGGFLIIKLVIAGSPSGLSQIITCYWIDWTNHNFFTIKSRIQV